MDGDKDSGCHILVFRAGGCVDRAEWTRSEDGMPSRWKGEALSGHGGGTGFETRSAGSGGYLHKPARMRSSVGTRREMMTTFLQAKQGKHQTEWGEGCRVRYDRRGAGQRRSVDAGFVGLERREIQESFDVAGLMLDECEFPFDGEGLLCLVQMSLVSAGPER
ncbi:MAG: hypothetical protein Q9159_006301 [Coniocarpon cinnabarinum]